MVLGIIAIVAGCCAICLALCGPVALVIGLKSLNAIKACRLRLHVWEARTNSETGEHYKVCRQCNAYRGRRTWEP